MSTQAAGPAGDARLAGEAGAAGEPEGACSGSECFALRVLGEDMAPEFLHGEIIIFEPGGVAKDGSYVLARHAGEWLFRQLRLGRGQAGEEDRWQLRALNPACQQHACVTLDDLGSVQGVVIQKAVPGRRRLSRFYV